MLCIRRDNVSLALTCYPNRLTSRPVFNHPPVAKHLYCNPNIVVVYENLTNQVLIACATPSLPIHCCADTNLSPTGKFCGFIFLTMEELGLSWVHTCRHDIIPSFLAIVLLGPCGLLLSLAIFGVSVSAFLLQHVPVMSSPDALASFIPAI